jgi:ABC-type multidrug transport system ATPase subunit
MSLIINNISKSFGAVKALRELSLKIAEGELFGLIGPDGAGKTTLFRIISSLMLPDTGSCSMLGFDTVKDYREIRQMIGYMPGRFSLYMDLTVEENLDFYARVFGSSIQDNYDLVREVYGQIAPFRKRRAGKLSGGMKQKLALSCALIHRPRVLILDEPTTGVDAVSRQEFWEMLKKIQGEGITIVVSTPYMDEAERCDRVALMQRGSILHVSRPRELGRVEKASIFALRSERGIHGYLNLLRKMPEVRHAWLFGDALHVVPRCPGGQSVVEAALKKAEDPSLKWEAMAPGIEDTFMMLLAEQEKVEN